METTPAAVVLAAGRSRRLGRPKALVGVNGRPLVAWIHQRLLAAGCEVMVVVNPDLADDVRAVLPGALIAVNDNPDAGRTRSLQLGLQALSEHLGRSPQRLVMAPVDRPGWNEEMLVTLLSSSQSAALAHNGRRGRPVVLDAPAIERVLAARPDASLRALVDFSPVEVHAPWLHLNIDTEDDVSALNENEAALATCFPQGEGI